MILQFNKLRATNRIQVWDIENNRHFADIDLSSSISKEEERKFIDNLKDKF